MLPCFHDFFAGRFRQDGSDFDIMLNAASHAPQTRMIVGEFLVQLWVESCR